MSLRFLLGHVASPLYESADGLGAGAAVDTPPPDDGGSLSEHEASFAPGRVADGGDDSAEIDATRDDVGRFKPRHRAASQRATAEDVPRIKDLTQKWRTTETERDALKAERDTLARERDELKARVPAAAEPPKPAAEPAAKPSEAEFEFPDYDTWLEKNPSAAANPSPTAAYDQWRRAELAAFYDWKDSRSDIDSLVRQSFEAVQSQREFDDVVDRTRERGRTAYPDFDAVVKSGPGVGVKMHATDIVKARQRVAAIFAHPQSEHLEYAILKDGALANKLAGLDDISFGIELATLVASVQRSPSTRSAAARPDQPPVPVRPPAPRPPNPVRTGSIAEPDTPPDPDDQSLAAHEKFYSPKRR